MNNDATVSEQKEESLRVLILDDEENIRRWMRVCLEKSGCEVDEATNGRSGLQRLLRQHYDVVVTDYRMAEMDGLTFIQEAWGIWPWMGVVLISGYMGEGVLEKLRRLGVRRVLEKPVSNECFIRNVLEEGEASRRQDASGGSESLNVVHYQLNILRQITDSALKEQSLHHAMEQLAKGLQGMIHCDMVGVLGLEQDGGYLLLDAKRSQWKASIDELQKEMIMRYQALSGRSLFREQLQVLVEGEVREGEGGSEIHHITSVPVIANDRVLGMLSLAFTREARVTPLETSFLYHAANHFSTVLQAVGEIRKLAILDPLTGAYNRRYLEVELERIWLLAMRYEHEMAVMVIDVDHFKEINDTQGHAVGDAILVEFARELRAMTRASDLLVRMGGDEFVLVLPHIPSREATELAKQIVLHMGNHGFFQDGKPIHVTSTIGVSWSRPGDQIFSHTHLLEKADQALYWAKRRGRDQIAVWSPEGEFADVSEGGEAGRSERMERGVLVVNDDSELVSKIVSLLQGEGYVADVVSTLEEARERLRGRAGSYLFLMTGFTEGGEEARRLLKEVRKLDPQLVRMVVSDHVTADKAVAALREGAYDIVDVSSKRFQVVLQLGRALDYRRLLHENQEYQKYLEAMVRRQGKELSQRLEEVKTSYEFALEAMVGMLDAREYETSLHSKRVTVLTRILAEHVGIPEPDLSEIGRGAMLHDIGKVAIPDRILRKAGSLTEEEWAVMRTHPEMGYNFVKSSEYLRTAAEIVYCHHESFDGEGYPRGIKGEEIPMGARVFSLVDSYDAMRSPRIYKDSIPMEEALEEIRNQAGRQFDPWVVEKFLEVVDEIEEEGQWPNGEFRVLSRAGGASHQPNEQEQDLRP